jgi:hypothetical protein
VARSLLGLQQLDRIGEDPPSPTGEAKDALQRSKRVGRALRRATVGPQFDDQRRYVLDPERGNPPRGKMRQQVVLEVVAVGLKGARVPLGGGDLRLEAGKPPASDGVEAQPRRGRNLPSRQSRDQLLAGAPGGDEVAPAGAEVKAAGMTGADRVVAVGLAVDAALDPGAARALAGAIWRSFS